MNKEVITIFRYRNPVNQETFFPFYAGVWGVKTDNKWSGVLYDITQPQKMIPKEYFDVQEITLITETGKTEYQRVTTIDDIVQFDGSFYQEDNFVLIHFENNFTPYDFTSDVTFQMGATIGFFNSKARSELVVDQIDFDNRLKDFPVIKSTRDNLLFGKQRFQSASITIDNTDGKYNNFAFGPDTVSKNGWWGILQRAVVDVGATVQSSDLVTVYQGRTQNISENVSVDGGQGLRFNLNDLRSSLTAKVGNTSLIKAAYPDIDINEVVYLPVTYGKLNNVPCPCLNANVVSGNFKFLLADATFHNLVQIDAISIDGNDQGLTPTIQYATQSDGTKLAYFELSDTLFKFLDSSFNIVIQNLDKVSVTVQGYTDGVSLIQKSLYIARDIINNVYGIAFTSSFYNTTEWTAIEAESPNTGFYIDGPIQVNTAMSRIQKSFFNTEFQVQEIDRKYTWKDFDYDGTHVFKIYPDIVTPAGFIPSPANDNENIAAEILLKYDRNYYTNRFKTELNSDNKNNAIVNLNSDKVLPENGDNETDLVDQTGLDDQIDRIGKIFNNPVTRLNIQIPMDYEYNGRKAATLKAGEFVLYLANSPTRLYYGWLVCEIIESSPNDTDLKMNLSLRVQLNNDITFKQPSVIKSPYSGKIEGGGGFAISGDPT
jgi:hypothetical protein